MEPRGRGRSSSRPTSLYLIIGGRTPLRRGSAQDPGTGDELLVGGYKIRVIDEDA
jgi:hypothetical protein